jgi:putative membrane protein
MMEALTEYIIHLGIVAVIAVIFAESGLLVGFFLPGDSLLFMSGFLTQQGIFKINIHLFALLLFIAAVAGDNVGYSFGKRVGRKLFERPNSRLFKQQYLVQAEQFFEKHGSKAIVLARFVPVVRTFTPIIAGVSTMHYRTFFVYNLIGGFLWTGHVQLRRILHRPEAARDGLQHRNHLNCDHLDLCCPDRHSRCVQPGTPTGTHGTDQESAYDHPGDLYQL